MISILSAKFVVMVYCLSTGPMEIKQGNHFNALGGSFIYFLWFTSMGTQRGKEASGKKKGIGFSSEEEFEEVSEEASEHSSKL